MINAVRSLQITFGVVVWAMFAGVVLAMFGVALYRALRWLVRRLMHGPDSEKPTPAATPAAKKGK